MGALVRRPSPSHSAAPSGPLPLPERERGWLLDALDLLELELDGGGSAEDRDADRAVLAMPPAWLRATRPVQSQSCAILLAPPVRIPIRQVSLGQKLKRKL